MNIKHYVINLKRRPDKLWAWIGAMNCYGFPFQNLTIFEAIDAKEFASIDTLVEFAAKIRLEGYAKLYKKIVDGKLPILKSQHFKNLIALNLGITVLLKGIEKQDDKDWHVIWLDDVVLDIVYTKFKELLTNSPENAAAIAFNKIHKPDLEILVHSSLLFYHGPYNKFDHCFAVTSAGAGKIINIKKRRNLYHSWETVISYKLSHKYQIDTSYMYTAVPNYVSNIGKLFIPVSDVYGTEQIKNTYKIINWKDFI